VEEQGELQLVLKSNAVIAVEKIDSLCLELQISARIEGLPLEELSS
jgi:hypothetical protein